MRCSGKHTLVEVGLVEVFGSGNVHVIETGNLLTDRVSQPFAAIIACSKRVSLHLRAHRGKLTFRWPLKCWRSLISRKARLARIFLLNTLVTFLMATPSFVWLFTAALLC